MVKGLGRQKKRRERRGILTQISWQTGTWNTWGVTMEISHIKRSKQKRAGAGGWLRRSCSSTPIFWRIGLNVSNGVLWRRFLRAAKVRRLKFRPQNSATSETRSYYWLKVQNHNRWFRPICLPSLFWRELGRLLRCNGTFCVEQHTQPLFIVYLCPNMLSYKM